ncbi:MAG: GNAT family N-acetyltransferase [Desulfobacterales bacterium]|nr:GNAT family N-acetyltransferase [Desulfobacterales bacterium]
MSYSFQYEKLAQALYWALKEDAFYFAMEKAAGGNESARNKMFRYMDYSMVEAREYGELYLPSDHEHGVSIWSKPLARETELKKSREKKDFLLEYMGEECLKTYVNIVDFMSEKAEPLIGDDFWYLSIVGILPAFQGQGLGPGLINSVLKQTDALNVPTFLETFTPRNMSFYNRLGYEAVDSFFEPTAQCEYWVMVREPRTP